MIGILFAAAGMSVFLGMIVVTEISIKCRELLAEARLAAFDDDTDIFPDFIPTPNESSLI